MRSSDIETAQKLSDRINPEGLFVSSFDDHSSGRKKLDDVSHSQKEKGRFYRGINFFDLRGLSVLPQSGSKETLRKIINDSRGNIIFVVI